jgi:hypothetical protein
MNRKSLLPSLCCLGLSGAVCLFSIKDSYALVPSFVVPNSATTTEGNGANSFPFDISSAGRPIETMRYQQLYDASQFSGLGSGGFITQIIFRPDVSFGFAFDSTLPDLQINLSTTSVPDDGLSFLFASNIGADDTVVFSGPLPLSSDFTGGIPKDFDIVINLATPFFYAPSMGNLLLDVRNFGAGLTTAFDSVMQPHDGVSRISTNSRNGVNQTQADFKDTEGLVTGFTIGSSVLGLTNAVSELGGFDVMLPGVECRSNGAQGRYSIVFTFNNNIVSVGGESSSCGQVRGATIDSNDPRRVIVNLRHVSCDGSDIAVSLADIDDDQGNNLPTASTSMTLLFGDVTGDGAVDDVDLREVRMHKGETTNETNFRDDVNVDGVIDSIDGRLVKSAVTMLP